MANSPGKIIIGDKNSGTLIGPDPGDALCEVAHVSQ
jgi:hypothetical protein